MNLIEVTAVKQVDWVELVSNWIMMVSMFLIGVLITIVVLKAEGMPLQHNQDLIVAIGVLFAVFSYALKKVRRHV
jgi:hypothetical protein